MSPVVELARAYVVRYLAAHARPRREGSPGYGPSAGEVAAALGIVRYDAEGDEVVDEYDPTLDDAVAGCEVAVQADVTIESLVTAFDLMPLDVSIVAILLAPELDPNLERAYSFALDDFTKKRPDIRFVADLIGGRDVEVVERTLRRFSEDMPLRRNRLVAVSPGDLPATARIVRLADRIVEFCRGHDVIDDLVRRYVSISTREPDREQLVVEPALFEQIARAFESTLGAPRVALVGPEGCGRALVVEAIHANRGRTVVRIDLGALVTDDRI
ncbi:MAG: hypothetical protein NT062_13595, partial [Proteobacteria bacterium]|nr:hypothetical protein [Pseudomonadota bacterium]